ncbi:unnamed protein product [Rhizoctonia solani]|uniref:Pyrroline-5-carboxylate reductase n=1 Tax=Rhizoctonia solani TaxID=456999 RepID=A0A8H3HIT9_9AGAM|nr:unnamed protein product [Rhizoctonia solani]
MGYTLCVLGCGTMGVAVLSGVITSLEHRISQNNGPSTPTVPTLGHPSISKGISTPNMPGTMTPNVNADELPDASIPTRFLACVNRAESAKRLKATFRSTLGLMTAEQIEILCGENLRAVQESDVVLLCCKPQMAGSILGVPEVAAALEGKLLISILAGVTIQQLTDMVPPSTRVVRAMPNTPCRIREGMTVVTTIPFSSSPTPSALDLQLELDRAIILALFSSIGRCRFLDEKHFDACTGLSGSGPAFACIVLEAMTDGGVMMGLPRTEALELAAQTLQGTARMVLQSSQHPAQVKDSVTTPGGSTIAGLLTLEDGRVRSTIARAIQVATERASVLGQPAQRTLRRGTGSPEAKD